METQWILVQVSEDTFSHMADDLKYLGQSCFRGSMNYAIPEECSNIVIYSGFNLGTFFPIFVGRVNRIYRKNSVDFICTFNLITKIVSVEKDFANEVLMYAPSCKTNFTEEIGDELVGKIWITIQKSKQLASWSID